MTRAVGSQPIVSMIALMSENHALAGPVHSPAWRAPWLVNRSVQVTRNRPVLIGRRAFHYMNMLGADRWLFVVTRDEDLLEAGGNHHLSGYGFWFLPDLGAAFDAALHLAKTKSVPEVFVAGGVSLYVQALPRVERLYRTVLHEQIEEASRLDSGALDSWREVHSERRVTGQNGFPDQTYSVIERAM